MSAIAEKLVQALINYVVAHPDVLERVIEGIVAQLVARLEAKTAAVAPAHS